MQVKHGEIQGSHSADVALAKNVSGHTSTQVEKLWVKFSAECKNVALGQEIQ